jgi:hypothetical protein
VIGPSHFCVNRLWLPSPIKIISSKCFYENESINSIVIENLSELEGIDSEAFQKLDLKFSAIPDSVEVLG